MVLSRPQHYLQPRPGRGWTASLLLAILLLPAAWAQEEGEDQAALPTILDRSPFIPPGWSPPEAKRMQAVQPEAAGYEFRGVYQIGGKYRFLVSEPRSRSGSWVELGKSYEGYEVRGYDPTSDTLTLFFNNKETPVKLASVEANPTPLPVSGQAKVESIQKAASEGARPVRRTIRPASRSTEDGAREPSATPPPPAWLQRLREEAAARRAQGGAPSTAGGSGSDMSASGSVGPSPGFTPPPPPDWTPPTPPPNLSEIDIPPPPTSLPPPPPPEIMSQIEQSLSGIRTPGT